MLLQGKNILFIEKFKKKGTSQHSMDLACRLNTLQGEELRALSETRDTEDLRGFLELLVLIYTH